MRAESNGSQCSSWYATYAAVGQDNRVRMRSLLSGTLACMLFVGLCSIAVLAQGPGQAITGRPETFDTAENAAGGRQFDGYFVQQSIELGGRVTDVSGNGYMYNTIVDLHSGPRLLQQSLVMRALPNTKSFFDTLYEENFGWGGDSSNAARFRISKRGIYDFTGSFRRDKNFFDYNLLANPLNNTAAAPTTPAAPFIDQSPHSLFLTRRMYDFDVVILPQHKFSFRLGFSRNRNEGPSFSTDHQGTEALLFQPYSTTENHFRFGVSWRALPRTTVSFNESLRFIKYDTSEFLFPSGLEPVNLAGFLPPIVSSGAGANAFTTYSRLQRYRNFLPTEQISLNSSSIRHVDLTARYMYSNADATSPLAENFTGLVTRTHVSSFNTDGSQARATWVANEAEGGVTIHLRPNLRLVDTFRYYATRVPGQFNLVQSNFFSVFNGTLYTAASPADLQNELNIRSWNQKSETNEFSVQWDFSPHMGARAGYLYRHLTDSMGSSLTFINDVFFPGNLVPGNLGEVEGCEAMGGAVDPVTGACIAPLCLALGGAVNPATGNCVVAGVNVPDEDENELLHINQHWAIGGVWFRWGTKVHADAEVRIMSADNFLTRIDPRREQQYRANVSFTPEPWLTLNANINLREQRNNTGDIAYNGHYRNFGFSAVATRRRITAELSYMYSNAGQNATICYIASPAFVVPGSIPCINAEPGEAGLLETLSFYVNHTHFGSVNIQFRPMRRLVLGGGYSAVAIADGNTLILHPLQPLGALDSMYQQPFAMVGVEVAKRVELRAGYNYYGYGDSNTPISGAISPIIPRNFHANVETFSLRYTF